MLTKGMCCFGQVLLGNHGLIIHVDHALKSTSYLKSIADQVHLTMVFSNGSALFQLDNVQCHTAWIVPEWFAEQEEEFQVLSQ